MTDVPARVGPYLVAEKLGSGGMGDVYLAYSRAGDPVAVKFIRADRLDPVTRQRFEREAHVARTVTGTNRVARFLDADPRAERPWLAVEYISGVNLHELVEADGPLPPMLVASLGALLAEGLSAVHDAGLVHRDLKPQNVIMGESGPALIDFGLAALTDRSLVSGDSLSRSGSVVGTPRCMAPEQAGGNPKVGVEADVYALGTVLLYAATGHYPYAAETWLALVAQVASAEHLPDLSGLPEVLRPLATEMMAHQPEDRPSLDEVTERCAAVMAQYGVQPAQARRMLVERTRRAEHGRPVLTPLLEEALACEPEPAGPAALDAPPVPEPALAPENQEFPPPPAVPPGAPRARMPASERIADELREAYALRSDL